MSAFSIDIGVCVRPSGTSCARASVRAYVQVCVCVYVHAACPRLTLQLCSLIMRELIGQDCPLSVWRAEMKWADGFCLIFLFKL